MLEMKFKDDVTPTSKYNSFLVPANAVKFHYDSVIHNLIQATAKEIQSHVLLKYRVVGIQGEYVFAQHLGFGFDKVLDNWNQAKVIADRSDTRQYGWDYGIKTVLLSRKSSTEYWPGKPLFTRYDLSHHQIIIAITQDEVGYLSKAWIMGVVLSEDLLKYAHEKYVYLPILLAQGYLSLNIEDYLKPLKEVIKNG
jgi:hypothetical protein